MTNRTELVSVVIPVYNASQFVETCLTSICKQTYRHLEIIVVDDGSTDDTLTKCRNFRDDRIIIVSQKNRGVSSARNNGLDLSHGDWIVFLDADDQIKPIAIERAIDVAHQNGADTVCWNCCGFTDSNPHIKFLPFSPKAEFFVDSNETDIAMILESLYYTFDMKEFYPGQMFRASWGKLLNGNIIRKHNIRFPVNMPLGEDAAFLSCYFKKINKIAFIDEALNYYRITVTSAVGKYRDNILELQKEEERIIENLFKKCVNRDTIMVNYYMECDRQYINNLRKKKQGVIYLIREMHKYICAFGRANIERIDYKKVQIRKILLALSIKYKMRAVEILISLMF